MWDSFVVKWKSSSERRWIRPDSYTIERVYEISLSRLVGTFLLFFVLDWIGTGFPVRGKSVWICERQGAFLARNRYLWQNSSVT